MATEKRDIELAIRATDLSTAELSRVAKAVDTISAGLQKQAEAARKGEVSLGELKQTLDELRQAGTALANQQGLIDSFTRLSGAIAKSETALAEAQQKLAQFNAESAKADALTTKQTQRQNNLAAAIGVAERKLADAQKRQREYNESIAGNDALTKKQTDRQTALAEKTQAASAALETARRALAEFNAEAIKSNAQRAAQQQATLERAVKTATAALENQNAEQARVRSAMTAAGLDANNLAASQQQIVTSANQVGAAITSINATIGAYAQNQRELSAATRAQAQAERDAAKAASDRAALVQRALETVSARRKEEERLIRAVRAAETAAEREAATAAQKRIEENRAQAESFQRLADTLERTSQGFKAIAVAQKGATSTNTLDQVLVATGTTAGVNNAARRNLAGIETLNDALRENVAATEKARGPVERYVETLQDAERTLARVQQIAKQVDGYQTQADAVRRAEAALNAAEKELAQYTEALRDPARASEELAAKARLAADSVRNAGASLVEQRGRLASLEQGLTEAGVDTRNLERDQRRLAEAAKSTTDSLKRLNAAVRARGVSEGDNFALFGLRPFELQNLSFQINDFFTQIASGTSVTQAFAQQIGQVLQINRVGSALAAAAPLVVSFGIAAATAAGALLRLNDSYSLLRQASAQRVLSGGFDPDTVLRAARAAERLGVSFTEAREAALAFSTLPIPADRYETLVSTFANLSVATGDSKRALDDLRTAFAGGVEGILDLANKYGAVLTPAQREFIRNATSERDVLEAQRIAIDAFSRAIEQSRRDAVTPLGEAFRDLRKAWRDFLDSLATPENVRAVATAIEAITDAVADLAEGLSILGPLLPILGALGGGVAGAVVGGPGGAALGAVGGTLGGVALTGALGDFSRRRAARNAPPATPPGARSPNDGTVTFDEIETELRRGEVARRNAEAAAARAGDEIDRRQRLARIEEQLRLSVERRATAEQQAAGIAAAREKAIIEFRRSFANATQDQLNAAADLAEAEQRRRIREAQERDAERGARADAAARRRELSDIEQDIRAVEQQRNDATRTIQEDIASGTISAVEGMRRLQQVAEQTRPKFAALADEAQRFVDANRGQDGLRDARADALISRTQRLAGGGGEQAANTAVLRQQQQQLQQSVQERATLIQTINALEQQGAITSSEAQNRIREAYALTNAQITEQINGLEQLVNLQEASGKITETQAAAIRSQIELARAQLVLVDPEIARVRQAFEQTATSGGVRAFEDVAQAIGEAALNMRTLGDVTQETGRVALKFFADLLLAIGRAILQQQILNAVQAIGAIFSGGATAAAGQTRIPVRPPGIGGIGSARLGGVVGPSGIRNSAKPRRVNPAWFVDAPHYQSGGLPGLRPDEEAAILHRGEEVLTKDDPRNIMNMMRANGGGSGGSEVGIRQVLVMDPSAITEALSGAAGEQVIVTHLRKNASTVRQIVRG